MSIPFRRLLPLMLAVLLVGCGTARSIVRSIPGFGASTPQEQVSYIPPTQGPGSRQVVSLGLPPAQAWDAVLDGLRDGPFRIANIDEREGLIILTYDGEPAPYIACGQIASLSPGREPVLRPANAPTLVEQAADGSRIERTLKLDSRVTVLLSPSANGTALSSEAHHVAVKEVRRYNTAGREVADVVDLADFVSGERGRFAAGTACQSTGELERLALRGILGARTS